ncbi:MAG: nucleoside phosphorylase [Clostridia bacterium]|nr:nucleoside phosphorylase [Clostridia bacterium]
MIIFDDKSEPIIKAENCIHSKPDKFPSIAISCYSKKLLNAFLEYNEHKIIAETHSASNEVPVYEIERNGRKIALFCSQVGAPASVGIYEDFIAMGLDKLILFGTCGVLSKDIQDCSIVIPTSSVREEGTSFHYVKASDEMPACTYFIDDFTSYLKRRGVSFVAGKNWTTDVPYRETKDKVAYFKERGVLSVDMEHSAMAACAAFHKKKLLHFFYAADNLDNDTWDKRSLSNSARIDKKLEIFELVIDYALHSKLF